MTESNINMPVHLKIRASNSKKSNRDTFKYPQGFGKHTFNHFLSTMTVNIGGRVSKANPGDCLIHTPDCPQNHEVKDGSSAFDCCVFDGSEIPLLIKSLALPVNKIFRPASTHFVSPLLEKITVERERKANHWEMIVSLALEELLVKLSRHWGKSQAKKNGHCLVDPQEKLEDVRAVIHDQLERQWSIPDMAQLSNLSTSRFAFLYKKSFEVSPMEDLIRQRIRHAATLLSDTRKSISEISEESGFEDLQYFYRAFKKRIGVTPKNLRDRNSTSSPWRSYEEERGKLEAVWTASDFHGMIGSDDNGVAFIEAVSGDWSELGWTRQELTRKPLLDLIHRKDGSLVAKATHTVSTGGILKDLLLRTLCKNNSYRKVAWTGIASSGAFYFSAKIGELVASETSI